MVAVYAMTTSTISTRQANLDSLNAQVVASQSQNTELSVFSQRAAESAARKTTIAQLVQTRFDWAHALREIPRVLPKDVWLESMSGTVAPTETSSGTTTDTAVPEPATRPRSPS
jgi:Tfp pilus assembly protein PilN